KVNRFRWTHFKPMAQLYNWTFKSFISNHNKHSRCSKRSCVPGAFHAVHSVIRMYTDKLWLGSSVTAIGGQQQRQQRGIRSAIVETKETPSARRTKHRRQCWWCS